MGEIARACAARGTDLLIISTNEVFDGARTDGRGYAPDDERNPINAYGTAKAAAEQLASEAFAGSAGRLAIVRTAWLFGAHGKNFVDTILKLAATRETLQVVSDQKGCPTWAGHLAPALVTLAESNATGIFHAAGGGRCTWFDLAAAALAATGSPCTVEPTTSEAFPSPTPRPAFSVLGTERGADAVHLPPWEEGLAGFLAGRPVAGTDITTTGDPR